MNQTRSQALYQKALSLIPGGVNSPVRAFGSVGAAPVFADHAKGSHLFDADGNRYLDFITSWGPLVLGHCPDFLEEELLKAAKKGTSFGLSTEAEVEMAQTVVEAYPAIDMVRMVNSGTEATMSAIRAARGYTGRDKVIKFEGCYHGHHDGMLVRCGSGALTFNVPTSPGVPKAVVQDTVVCRYNDLADVKHAFLEHPGEIAAVILEPVAANMGVVPPTEEFLKGLRALTERERAVLIFDEVITGFRLAFGGASEFYGVRPDMACFGKIIGAGLPVGAYGGKRDIMEQVSPAGPVYQAGTLSGNPLAMAMGLAMLRHLRDNPGVYAYIGKLAKQLADGIEKNVEELGLDYAVTRVGSLVCLFCGQGPMRSYDDVKRCDVGRFSTYFASMLEQGFLVAPSQFEAMFVSAAHTPEEIGLAVAANRKALEQSLRKG